jgi:branched-chain amino acid transport system permease protein
VGVGAYTLASFSTVIGGSHVLLTHGWPLMILISGMMGAVFGAFVGLPAMRLKHLYLAIATLSFQMIFEWVINFLPFFNQGQMISVGRVFWLTGKVDRNEHYVFWYYVILVIVVVLGFAVRNLLRTKYGRCLIAVRDNDRAADAMGMHPGLTKVFAFGLAGFFAGVAGALHCYLYRGAGIESFTLHHSITYLAMAIVGGLGTVPGSLLGPAAIYTLELQVEHLSEWSAGFMPETMNLATALRPLAFGLTIVLFLMFEPRGIANWWRIIRSYFKLWPFRY